MHEAIVSFPFIEINWNSKKFTITVFLLTASNSSVYAEFSMASSSAILKTLPNCDG